MKDTNFPTDSNLEPRIVAWVLGEASPFEVAELERHLIEHPELAVFKRRIEAVHGLIDEAVRPVAPLPKLSDERRAKLLATFGATPPAESGSVMALKPYRVRSWWQVPPAWMAAAACLMVGLVLLWLAVPRNEMFDSRRKPSGFYLSAEKRSIPVEMPRIEVDDRGAVAASTSAPRIVASPAPQYVAPATTDFKERLTIAQGDVVGHDADGRPIIRLPEFAVVGERQEAGYAAMASTNTLAGSRLALPIKRDIVLPKPALPDLAEIADKAETFAYAGPASTSKIAARATKTASAPQWTAQRFVPTANPTSGSAVVITSATIGGNLPNNLTITSSNGAIASDQNANVTMDGARSISFGPANVNGSLETTTFGAQALTAKPARPDPSATLLGLGAGGFAAVNGGTSPRDNVVALDEFSVGGSVESKKAQVASTNEKDSNVSQQVVPEDANATEAIVLSPFEVATPKTAAAKRRAAKSSTKESAADSSKAVAADFATREAATTAPATPVPEPAATPAEADQPIVHPEQPTDESLRAEVQTQTQSISTFSLHVSDVSFRLAQAALDKGQRPDRDAIRPEEFYNAFDYGDPAPVTGEPVSCRIEQAADPFLQQRNLVRIAMKIPATGRGAGQPLRLTVLLDTSGSMEREDCVATVRQAFSVLASLVGADDQITLIGFARRPRLIAERVRGADAKKLVDIVAHTPAEGGTNLEEALKLAGEQARAQFQVGAQNRIVVLTDGAANLGNDDPNRLAAQVAVLRQQGISFDACGIGIAGLDDSVLEALTRKGDGRYYVINSPEEADSGFAHQLAGALRPAAENVKVQVRFNPARVQAYRLIGFEQHRLKTEDFRNDQVTAAELAADEGANALYQVQVKPDGEGELGDVFVRFRNAATGAMVERSWTLTYEAQPAAFDRAAPSIQLAGVAAFVAEKLRGGAPAGPIRLADLAPTVNRLRGFYSHDARVQQLVTMFGQTRRLLNE